MAVFGRACCLGMLLLFAWSCSQQACAKTVRIEVMKVYITESTCDIVTAQVANPGTAEFITSGGTWDVTFGKNSGRIGPGDHTISLLNTDGTQFTLRRVREAE